MSRSNSAVAHHRSSREGFASLNQLRQNTGIAGVAELADAQVLGACGEIRVGSSPSARTNSILANFYKCFMSIGFFNVTIFFALICLMC